MSAPVASRHTVAFVLVTVFLDMVGYGLIIPVLPQLIGVVGEVDLATAAVMGGGMYAAFALAQFVFGPLVGNLSDRFGRRPLLLLAIGGLGLDFLLHAFAPSLFWLFVGRVIAGICGSSWIIANAALADVTPPEGRARAFGLMGAAFGLGFVLGPAIGGLLGEFGPRVPFYVAAGISGLNLLYGWFVLPETLPADKRRPFHLARANPLGTFVVFRQYGQVLPLAGVLALFFFASAIYPAIWPFWGMAKFDWSPAMVGLSLAFFGIVTAMFQGGLSGMAARRFGETRTAVFGLISASVAALGYGLAGGIVAVVVLFFIHGPEGFVHPMLTARMSRIVPDDAQGELQGGLSAVTNLAMLGGTLFYTAIFGWFLSDAAPFRSPDVAFFVASAILAGILLLLLAILRRAPQPQAA